MRISPIQPFIRKIAFKGNYQSNNFLSENLSDIFHNSNISNENKKILWELSEIPDFCAATDNLSSNELLQLSEIIKNAATNIMEMILKGKVKLLIGELEGSKIKQLISLKSIARHNQTAPKDKKINLFNVIKSSNIEQIENCAQEIYKKSNLYPTVLITNEQEDDIPTGEEYMGVPITVGTKFISFDEPIKGKNDFIIKKYIPIDPKEIEPETFEMPFPIHFLYTVVNNPSLAKAIYELSDAPYFYNLAKKTSPENIVRLAAINNQLDNLIVKMFRKEILLDILNPNFNEDDSIKLPVIDVEKILLKKQQNPQLDPDMMKLIDRETYALDIAILVETFYKKFPNIKLQEIELINSDNEQIQNFYFKTNNKNLCWSVTYDSKSLKSIKNFINYIEKLPMKRIKIIFQK